MYNSIIAILHVLTGIIISYPTYASSALQYKAADQSKLFNWRLSLDLAVGMSQMNFNSQDAKNHEYSGANVSTFKAGSKVSLYGHFSFEPIYLRINNDLTAHISADFGYRQGTTFNVYSVNLQHDPQLQYGLSGRFEYIRHGYGIGFDMRNDTIIAKENFGSASSFTKSRPWIKLQYRYTIPITASSRWFFAADAAYALQKLDLDPYLYYRDYVINTGDISPLGPAYTVADSQDSFVKGHFPKWEIGLTTGYRFRFRQPAMSQKLSTPVVKSTKTTPSRSTQTKTSSKQETKQEAQPNIPTRRELPPKRETQANPSKRELQLNPRQAMDNKLGDMRKQLDLWYQTLITHSEQLEKLLKRKPEVETIVYSEESWYRSYTEIKARQIKEYAADFITGTTHPSQKEQARKEITAYYTHHAEILRHDIATLELVLANYEDGDEDIDWLIRYRTTSLTDTEILARIQKQINSTSEVLKFLDEILIPELELNQ